MEPQTHGDEFPNEAVAHLAPASNRIPVNPDDDELLVVPTWESGTVVDAWAGVEPPTEEPLMDSQSVEAKPSIEPVTEPMADFPTPIEPDEDESPEKGGWIVSLLGAGISIVAICLLLPLAEENHQLAWQREKLKTDLVQLQEQVKVNDEFIHKINDDPSLSERLAQRQMKFIRKGTTILDLPDNGKEETSPFQLVTLPPPNPIPPYRPLGGALSAVVRNPHLRLYLAGIGLLLLAAGLVLGGEAKKSDDPQ